MSGCFLGNCKAINVISPALTPVSVAANTSAAQSFTIPGILLGDYVEINKPTTTAGISTGDAVVTAINTISLTFVNDTASPIVPPAETYILLVVRPEVPGATNILA